MQKRFQLKTVVKWILLGALIGIITLLILLNIVFNQVFSSPNKSKTNIQKSVLVHKNQPLKEAVNKSSDSQSSRSTSEIANNAEKSEHKNLLLQTIQLHDLLETYSNAKLIPLCDIICNPSDFKKDKVKRSFDSFFDYYNENKEQAFDDPKYQLSLLVAESILIMLPRDLTQFSIDIELFLEKDQAGEIIFFEKQKFFLQFKYRLIKAIAEMTKNIPRSQNHKRLVNNLIDLRKSCESKPKDLIFEACQKTFDQISSFK